MSVYNSAPWKMKASEFEKYTPVTENNRKNAVVMGRVLYVIRHAGRIINYCGYIIVYPQILKGSLKITGNPHMQDTTMKFFEDQDYNEWKNSYNSVITHLIKEGVLFVNLNDPIIKFQRL